MSCWGTSAFEWAPDLIFCEHIFSLLWIGIYQLFLFNCASSVGCRPDTSLRYIWGFHYLTKIIHGFAHIPECHFFNLCIVIVVVRESWLLIQCDLISEKGRESTNKLESSFLQALGLLTVVNSGPILSSFLTRIGSWIELRIDARIERFLKNGRNGHFSKPFLFCSHFCFHF